MFYTVGSACVGYSKGTTALKAVLIKKKGFDPALLPPWISVDHSAGL
jgi:hypothetical protein